jgi:hypothetical protein
MELAQASKNAITSPDLRIYDSSEFHVLFGSSFDPISDYDLKRPTAYLPKHQR